MTDYFVGREREAALLEGLFAKKTSSLVVITGRRRIGKSRLVREFGRGHTFLEFSGLAPVVGVDTGIQIKEFLTQVSQQTGLPKLTLDDWSDAFYLLADQCKTGRVVILIDEITWLAEGDPSFLSKLKNAWDLKFSQNPKLVLILCGSVSAWIEKNIVSSTGFFGRISLKINLEELSLAESSKLLSAVGFKNSSLEKLMILAVTGGIPWYLEQVRGQLSALSNLSLLCLQKHSLLLDEYRHIFHDLFGKREGLFEKIVQALADSDLSYDEIAENIQYAKGSALSGYLDELEISGYLKKKNSWNLSSGKSSSRLVKYHLADNFLRFYFKWMMPRLEAIRAGKLDTVSPDSFPGWNSMMGLQVENLVIKNELEILKGLLIRPEEVLMSGPYFQRKTARQSGCQVDYMIQTRFKTIYLCEIKFSQNVIGCEVIQEVQEKINRMTLPRGFAVVPVLIHTGNLTEELLDADYFSKRLDLRDLLN